MTTRLQTAGPDDDHREWRRLTWGWSRKQILGALALVVAVGGAGLGVHILRVESGILHPAKVRPAIPAALLPTPPPAFPLKVGPTGRYLVDRNGRPFLIVGDSPQSLIVNLSGAQANRFFANRQAAGFNSTWINLLSQTHTGGRADGDTYDGIAPFTTPGDLSTLNLVYFARADEMIRLAAEHHLAAFLDPIETGGWLTVLRSNGTAKAYAYGRYVGLRYRRFTAIVWLSGNDFQTWSNPKDDAVLLAVAEGIRSADPDALQSIELNYLASTSLDDPRWSGIVDLDAAYSYYPTYAEVLKAYRTQDHIPAFMVEANYEGEHSYEGPETLRRQEYWTMLSGATGQFYGNHYTWPSLPGWPGYLEHHRVTATDLRHQPVFAPSLV